MKLEVTVSEIADIFKEIQERPGPVGKVRKNLPFFGELTYETFTNKS